MISTIIRNRQAMNKLPLISMHRAILLQWKWVINKPPITFKKITSMTLSTMASFEGLHQEVYVQSEGAEQRRKEYVNCIKVCGKKDLIREAEMWFFRMSKDPLMTIDLEVCHVLLDVYATKRDINSIFNFFERMIGEFNIIPTTKSCKMAASAFHRSSDINAVTKFYNIVRLEFGLQPTIYIFNAIIKVHVNAEAVKEAEKWLEIMTNEFKIKPDEKTMNCFVHAYSKDGDIANATLWFKKFRVEWKVNVDLDSANSLLTVFARNGDVFTATKIFDAMKRNKRIQPSQFTYNSIINAYARLGDTDNAVRSTSHLNFSNIFPSFQVKMSFFFVGILI